MTAGEFNSFVTGFLSDVVNHLDALSKQRRALRRGTTIV
jgi:hypothetical protein